MASPHATATPIHFWSITHRSIYASHFTIINSKSECDALNVWSFTVKCVFFYHSTCKCNCAYCLADSVTAGCDVRPKHCIECVRQSFVMYLYMMNGIVSWLTGNGSFICATRSRPQRTLTVRPMEGMDGHADVESRQPLLFIWRGGGLTGRA